MSGMGDAIHFWLGAFASPFLGFIAFCLASVLVMAVFSPVTSAQLVQVLKAQVAVARIALRSAWRRVAEAVKWK